MVLKPLDNGWDMCYCRVTFNGLAAQRPEGKIKMAKTWTPDEIKTLIATNDKAVTRALLALLDRQTADEQAAQVTSHSNGMGFTGVDAEILTSFAQQVQRGRTLSVKQMEIARRKLVKYAKQLALVANAAAALAAEIAAGGGPAFDAPTDDWVEMADRATRPARDTEESLERTAAWASQPVISRETRDKIGAILWPVNDSLF